MRPVNRDTLDQELESVIDDIGRDAVFDRAREVGWRYGDTPPKWVWWGIVAELREKKRRVDGQ
jgi:hypothetical protein